MGFGALETIAARKADTKYTKVHKDDQQDTAQTDKVLWTPASGSKFVITDMKLSTDTAMKVTLKDGTMTFEEFYFATNGGMVSNQQTPYESVTADNDLSYTSSAAGSLSISADGYEV